MEGILSSVLRFTNIDFGEMRVLGTVTDPLFCLYDVCKSLDLRVKDVVVRLTKGDLISKGVVSNDPLDDEPILSKHAIMTPGGIQQMYFVNEDGLYDVIFDSRKPQAKKFRKWITKYILPSIRKYGAYVDMNHDKIRTVTISVRTALTATIDYLNMLYDINKSSASNTYAFITNKANELVEIKNGERDLAPTEHLIRLIVAESMFVELLMKAAKKAKKDFSTSAYCEIINECVYVATEEFEKRMFRIEKVSDVKLAA